MILLIAQFSPQFFFVASLHLYFLFIFPFLPAVCLYGDVTQVVTMLSVSLSDLNQALSLVGSSFLVKSHWKPNLKLASRGLHRTCCIVLSISNEFNTLCGRSVATRRFIAAFVQLSMHLSYYTEGYYMTRFYEFCQRTVRTALLLTSQSDCLLLL